MIPHACSLGSVGRFVMFGIMAGMDLKNTFRRICHRCSLWTRLSCPLCAMTDIWPGPAGWVPFSAAPRIWQSLVRCSLWFDSGSHVTSVYSCLWKVLVLGQGVLALRCATTGAGLSGHFLLWRRGSSPWSSSSCSRCSSRTRLLLCPLLVNDRCRISAVAVLYGR